MRLNKLLKVSRPIKRRIAAGKTCGTGRVLVNDKSTKTPVSVKTGGIIETQFGARTAKVGVLNVRETVKGDEVKEFYRYIQRQSVLDVLTTAIFRISGIE